MKFIAAYLATTAALRLTKLPPKSSLAALKAKVKVKDLDECDAAAAAVMGIFDLIDHDNNGAVTLGEFKGGIEFLADEENVHDEIEELFDEGDDDSDGEVDMEEMKAHLDAHEDMSEEDKEAVWALAAVADMHGDGDERLSEEEAWGLGEFLVGMAQEIEPHMEEVFAWGDSNEDGEVSREEMESHIPDITGCA